MIKLDVTYLRNVKDMFFILVGHCHPHVVAAGKNQMATLVSAQGFMNDALTKYVKQLVNKLPDILSICYLVNSG